MTPNLNGSPVDRSEPVWDLFKNDGLDANRSHMHMSNLYITNYNIIQGHVTLFL